MSTVYGVIGHDTVTTRSWSDQRVDVLLRDGRPSVPGPLAQCGMDRTGRWRVIADGRCNHNGYGRWGNNAIGVEVYAAGGLRGHEEPWNARQIDSFVRGTAAILQYLGLTEQNVLGHKESDPRRKIDPYQIIMPHVRQRIATHLANGVPKEDALTPELRTYLENLKADLITRIDQKTAEAADRVNRGRNIPQDTKYLREGVREVLRELGVPDEELNPAPDRLRV